MDRGFQPIEVRAKAVVGVLALVILADLFSIWADVQEIQLSGRLLDGEIPSISELEASDNRQAVAGVLVFLGFVAGTITFLMWFSRAYRNLEPLGAEGLRFGKGWAIGAWFVPFLNLWRPKQIANDIWRASDPGAPPDQGAGWLGGPVPGLMVAWWSLWIVSIYAWNFSARLWFEGDEPADIRDADYADVVSLVLDIAAAILAILVIREMTRRQCERARAIAGYSPPVADL